MVHKPTSPEPNGRRGPLGLLLCNRSPLRQTRRPLQVNTLTSVSQSPSKRDQHAQRTLGHHGHNNNFKCSQCEKTFETQVSLRYHLRLHAARECADCGERFPSLFLSKRHRCGGRKGCTRQRIVDSEAERSECLQLEGQNTEKQPKSDVKTHDNDFRGQNPPNNCTDIDKTTQVQNTNDTVTYGGSDLETNENDISTHRNTDLDCTIAYGESDFAETPPEKKHKTDLDPQGTFTEKSPSNETAKRSTKAMIFSSDNTNNHNIESKCNLKLAKQQKRQLQKLYEKLGLPNLTTESTLTPKKLQTHTTESQGVELMRAPPLEEPLPITQQDSVQVPITVSQVASQTTIEHELARAGPDQSASQLINMQYTTRRPPDPLNSTGSIQNMIKSSESVTAAGVGFQAGTTQSVFTTPSAPTPLREVQLIQQTTESTQVHYSKDTTAHTKAYTKDTIVKNKDAYTKDTLVQNKDVNANTKDTLVHDTDTRAINTEDTHLNANPDRSLQIILRGSSNIYHTASTNFVDVDGASCRDIDRGSKTFYDNLWSKSTHKAGTDNLYECSVCMGGFKTPFIRDMEEHILLSH